MSNDADQCPNTPIGAAADALGCADSEKDDDADGVSNAADQCPNTPAGAAVDANGCADSEKDDDGDGVSNAADQCPNTPVGAAVDSNGCADSQKDDDGDGVSNNADHVPIHLPAAVDANGCADSQKTATVMEYLTMPINARIRPQVRRWMPMVVPSRRKTMTGMAFPMMSTNAQIPKSGLRLTRQAVRTLRLLC